MIRTVYLTAPEAAQHLRTTAKTVVAMCARGELPARKAGGQWIIPERAIEEYVPVNHAELQGAKAGDTKGSHLGSGQAARVDHPRIKEGRGQVRGKKASGDRGARKRRGTSELSEHLETLRAVCGPRPAGAEE